MAEVNVLLSCGNDDKTLKIGKDCTFSQFRAQVKSLFPHLPQNFTISDGDFNELNPSNFHGVKNSRLETWCLVRGSTEESYKLDKPHSELMRYDVHPNALTQSGNYHFSASYQAFCEFIDNSIQATSINNTKDMERTIDVHIFLKDKLVAIFDNGEGMTYEGLKAFATYFLSQADRGLEKEEVDLIPAYLDGAISKFGVGATQAGFYLGDRIKVITKKEECPYVTEITISKEKLQQRAKEGKPVFEDYRWIRNPSDTSTLSPGEEKRCLQDIIEREAAYTQFTMIVITGIRDIHLNAIREDAGNGLARNLAHVYHFYLFGDRGRSGNMKLPSLGNSKVPPELGMSSFLKVDIRLVIDDGRNSNQKTFFNLRDIDDDMESLYQTRAKEWFPFSLTMKVPGLDPHQTVQGVLMYFPHESGHETLPRPDDLEDDEQEPIFECFWQGRLSPLSYVHKMEFCTSPAQRSRKQKDVVPDSCYRRLKGILFFNRHTPVSNNKLKILLDERKDLSTALEDASTERRLPQEFRTWLEKCHRELDKEVSFDSPLPVSQQPKGSDVHHYCVLRVTTSSGVQVYKAGDIVKLDTKPIIYGKVMHFVKVSKKNDVDKVIVQRQPEEVYLDQVEERPISRILEIPDPNTLKRVFNQEKQMLPKTVKVYKDNLSNEITSKMQLHWLAGETQKDFSGFWVKVFNGEKPPKPLVTLHNKKISIRQVIEGPENIAPIQNDQPHDGEKFGFKPFWMSVAGDYKLKYIAMLGDREMASTHFQIVVKANIACFYAVTEPSQTETPQLALGEPSLKFKLAFKDIKNNPATVFSSGEFVKLHVTCPNLEVQGVKEKYKTNSDGILEVSGITLIPNGSDRVQYGKDLSVRVDVVGIGYNDYVTFPVRIKAGQPQSVKLPQFETTEVVNYEEFPEFTVQVLDQWSQPCSVNDRRTKLHAECEAFVGGPHLAAIEQGQGRFSPAKVKLAPGKAPCTVKIKISLVSVDSNRRKLTVSEILKELKQFSIKVLPSTLPHKVIICEGNQNEMMPANGVANGRDGRDCLELMAPAGSIVKGLFLKVFDESEKLLDAEEFKTGELKVTTSWSGEVQVKNLPYLPDCPVANLAGTTFVGNVECVCSDVKCQSQIRIKPIAGEPQKWHFVCETDSVEIECDSKRQLSQNLKIRVLDKLGNSAECSAGVEPMVSLDHSPSKSGSTAVFIGNIIRKGSEFVFNNEAIISGRPGIVTMSLYDKNNKFSKDTQKINLKAGAPHHIELKSQAFDDSSQKNEHTAKFFSNCFLSAPIHAYVCDRSGNKTPLKTTLNLSWTPGSCGLLLTKKTTLKGETVFDANTMKCGSRSGEQQVKLRVSSSDHKNLQAAIVTATLEKSNRVKTVVVQLAADQTLVATGGYPVLKVALQTEDGVRVDGVGHLDLEISRPSGAQTTAVYRKPTQNREGLVTFQPIANRVLEETGQWSIICQYTEYRDRLKSVLPSADHVTRSLPVQFMVQPGPPHRLVLRFPSGSSTVFSASCTADLKGRTILPRPGKSGVEVVEIAAEDSYGNNADVSMAVSVAIQPSGTVPEGTVLPALENSPIQVTLNHGIARLPRLTLCSRVGNYIGEYLLVFSAPGVESHSVKFAFSTDEHIQRIQNELQPLRKRIADSELSVSESKRKLSRGQTEYVAALTPVRSAFRGEPRARDVINILQTTKNQLNQYEASEATTRPAITQQGHPPARIRQFIKGIVAELAYVSDPLLARILSWYLQSKMQVALTSTTEQQRKVYDAGYSAYCEATLLPFMKKDFDGNDGKALPLELPSPPSNYRSTIEFAVNLLEFTSENGYLRCSLFWNLLSKTIVVKDLKSGQMYREHLTKMRQPCPTILTRDGNMIASDGLMDPKRRCPARMEDLRFAFGALPPRETAHYLELREKCEALTRLQLVQEKHEKEMGEVRAREEQLNEVRKSLSPRINQLERELRKLRPGLERDSSEPADKRRKR